MNGVNSIYLGWDNQRKAFSFPGSNPTRVVLIRGTENVVLTGHDADGFKKHIQELNHHHMGIEHSDRMAELVRKGDPYNTIFDEYWRTQ